MLLVVHVIERISDRRQRDANLLLYGEERFAGFRHCTQQSSFSQPAQLLATHSSAIQCHLTKRIIVLFMYIRNTHYLIYNSIHFRNKGLFCSSYNSDWLLDPPSFLHICSRASCQPVKNCPTFCGT